MEAQLHTPSTIPTLTNSPTTTQFGDAPTKRVVAHPPKEGGDVTNPGICTGQPDRPKRPTQTKTQGAARTAAWQQQYNEGTFSAHLAKALR
jgi:hypothetical protein